MIDLWHSVSKSALGRPIEVVADNRRNHPELRMMKDEYNVAFPAGYKGKVVLSVWLESFPNLKPLILNHEIGHWVLKFKGFRGMICNPRDKLKEGLLNDVASHRPLYCLQKSVGHDPQSEVDSRYDHNIKLYSQPGFPDKVVSVLYLVDDLLNCSYKKRSQLEWTLRRNHPSILQIVERILTIASNHDLSIPDQNVEFRKKLVKELNLSGVWSEKDDVKSTKSLIFEVEGRAPS